MTYKILIADDEMDVRISLKEAFAHEDMDISLAENGREALEKATTHDYDIIIIDLLMPHIDGVEALKVIHMSEPALPIIVVTGVMDAELKSDALKSGANLILQKPLDLNEVTLETKRLLGIRDDKAT